MIVTGSALPSDLDSFRSSSGSSQSIQNPRRIDCSVWRAANRNTRRLHELTNSSSPSFSTLSRVSSLSSFSTSISTHSPWQSNPF